MVQKNINHCNSFKGTLIVEKRKKKAIHKYYINERTDTLDSFAIYIGMDKNHCL